MRAKVGPAAHVLFAAEPEQLRLGSSRDLQAGGIVSVQHGKVARLLVQENPRLCVHILLKGAMTIKMVGSNVQHHGNSGPKALNGFQLEAGDLEHRDRLRVGFLDERDCWRADIASNQGGKST